MSLAEGLWNPAAMPPLPPPAAAAAGALQPAQGEGQGPSTDVMQEQQQQEEEDEEEEEESGGFGVEELPTITGVVALDPEIEHDLAQQQQQASGDGPMGGSDIDLSPIEPEAKPPPPPTRQHPAPPPPFELPPSPVLHPAASMSPLLSVPLVPLPGLGSAPLQAEDYLSLIRNLKE